MKECKKKKVEFQLLKLMLLLKIQLLKNIKFKDSQHLFYSKMVDQLNMKEKEKKMIFITEFNKEKDHPPLKLQL
jgi:hypothetical protein